MGSMEPLFLRAAFENTMCKRSTYTTLTLELRMSASSVAITHVRQLLYQEFDARMAYMHVYSTRSNIETMSKASEQIKVYSCIAPSAQLGMAICYHSRALRG